MQRLTKYSLLLKAVLKKTDDANQKKDLVEMVKLFLFWFFILMTLITYLGQKCRVTGARCQQSHETETGTRKIEKYHCQD